MLCLNIWYMYVTLCTLMNSGAQGVQRAGYGSGLGPIYLDNVVCDGTEARLIDCSTQNPTGTHNCDHSEDAGVRCLPPPPGMIIQMMCKDN